jgi:hypothetical protein
MTQRIAEADGGRVWMECYEDFNCYETHTRDGITGIAYGPRTETKWYLEIGYKVDGIDEADYEADTEADAVCLLWSKV